MSLLTSWLSSPPPDAAIEIAAGRLSAAAMGSRRGTRLTAHAVEALPPGAIVPSLTSDNVVDREAVAARLRSLVDTLGTRVSRVALVLPDASAKVSLVHFDRVPSKRADLDQLVRWQIRKSAPFAIEEACVSYTPASRVTDHGTEFVVVLAHRSVVEGYERVCADAGMYAGLIDITSLSVLNLLLATNPPSGDWLMVYMRPEDTSIAIVRDGTVIFFRNRPESDQDTLTDLVHQTAMYYQDRLAGQGLVRVMLGGSGRTPQALDEARHSLEERLGSRVEPIDPTVAAPLSDRVDVSPELLDALTPVAGLLLRTHREVVTA